MTDTKQTMRPASGEGRATSRARGGGTGRGSDERKLDSRGLTDHELVERRVDEEDGEADEADFAHALKNFEPVHPEQVGVEKESAGGTRDPRHAVAQRGGGRKLGVAPGTRGTRL